MAGSGTGSGGAPSSLPANRKERYEGVMTKG